MKIKFAPVPRLAKICYLAGFVLIIVSMYFLLSESQLLSIVLLQQIFIVGAIVVTLGSAINLYYQFRKKDR